VGTTVADLASEDATVVIGTVIDPDMNDELRVTVVATGLGSKRPKREERPMQVVRTGTDNRPAFRATEEDEAPSRGAQRREEADSGESRKLFGEQKEMDYLDIPAFLRNQAD
jgi:cell division protein FtsZ